jgi:hypothetical protein
VIDADLLTTDDDDRDFEDLDDKDFGEFKFNRVYCNNFHFQDVLVIANY